MRRAARSSASRRTTGSRSRRSIEPATGFWMAEEYHQCYLEKRAGSGGILSSLFGR